MLFFVVRFRRDLSSILSPISVHLICFFVDVVQRLDTDDQLHWELQSRRGLTEKFHPMERRNIIVVELLHQHHFLAKPLLHLPEQQRATFRTTHLHF